MAGGPPETAAEYSPEDAGLSATTNPTLHSLFLATKTHTTRAQVKVEEGAEGTFPSLCDGAALCWTADGV